MSKSGSGNQLESSRPAELDELGRRCEHQHLPPALRVPRGPGWAGAGRQQHGGGSQLGTPSSLSWSQASTGGQTPAGLGVSLPRHKSPQPWVLLEVSPWHQRGGDGASCH